MNIQDLGSIGELVAAIATLGTLIYLALQIRQGASATKAHIRQSIAGLQIDYINLRASDPTIRSAVRKMFEGSELTVDETMALRMHSVAGIRMFESYFAQYSMGTMSAEDWRATREITKGHFRFSQYRDGFLSIESTWHVDFAKEIHQIMYELDNE